MGPMVYGVAACPASYEQELASKCALVPLYMWVC